MATTRTDYGGWVNVGYGEFRLRQTITRTAVNIANNTSTVRVQTWIEARNGGWFTNIPSHHVQYVDGTKVVDTTINRSVANNGSTLVLDNYRTLTHNAIGDRSVYAEASFNNYASGSLWVGGTLALDRIPRATSATWAVQGTKYAGTTQRLNLPRASSAFTHDVTYKFGTRTGSLGTNLPDFVNWAIPLDLLEEFPNAASANGTFTTVTKNGGSVIGTTTSSFSLTAGIASAPAINAVSMDDANTTVKTNIGAFVQTLSLGKVSVTASATYGASIAQKRIWVDGVQTPENSPTPLIKSGPILVDADVVDSRGIPASKTVSFTVLPYEAPTLTGGDWSVRRADENNEPSNLGTYLRIDLAAVASSLLVGGSEKNSLTISVRTRPSGGSWTDRNNIVTGALAYSAPIAVEGDDVYLVTSSYDVELTLSDNTGTKHTLITTVATGLVALDLQGTNVGIGGYHERGTADIKGDAYAYNLYSDGTVEAESMTIGGIPDALNHKLQGVLYFTNNDSFVKASYPYCRAIRVRVQGAGGGAGGSRATAGGLNSFGQGGGGGGYAESFITDMASIPSSVPITVGAGGTGGVATGGAGTTGGTTSFGGLVAATGGTGGWSKQPDQWTAYVTTGQGGAGTAGDIQISGNGGSSGTGGGSLCTGGSGGSAQLGGGAGAQATGAGNGSSVGISAGNYGGGGSGSQTNAGGAGRVGGSGGPGVVIVELFG